MKLLIDNWGKVALKSHSMWAQYLGIAALVAPEVLYAVLGYDLASPRLWWGIGVALVAYGVFGRLKYQGLDR